MRGSFFIDREVFNRNEEKTPVKNRNHRQRSLKSQEDFIMAKIDTTLISGYEDMTAEEKLAALENYEYDDKADEISRLKAANTKASKEAAEWKRKHNALLDDDSRKQQEADERVQAMEEELKSLRRDKTLASYKASYVSMGYSEDLAAEVAEAMADGDTDKVFDCQKRFLESHDKEITKGALQKTPRPGAGAGEAYKTKEDIMKIKDSTERQQAIKDNFELFD